jgi:hypothetical protein
MSKNTMEKKVEQAKAFVGALLKSVRNSQKEIKGIPVSDHDDYREVCNLLFETADSRKQAGEERDQLVADEKATLAAVGAEYAPLDEGFDEFNGELKQRVRDYAMECEARYNALLAKAAKLAKTDPKKARELNARAEDELAPKVKGIAFVAKVTPKVLDQKKVPKEFYKLVLDEDKLAMAARDGVEVPGVVFEDVRTVRVTPSQREVK